MSLYEFAATLFAVLTACGLAFIGGVYAVFREESAHGVRRRR